MSTPLIQYTEALTAKISQVIATFRQREVDPELQQLLDRWEAQLHNLRNSVAERDTVSVAVLGGTGAGKSTLINALLDVDLLPTHSFRICTAAAVEIGYAPTKQIALQLEFIAPETWEAEKQAFLSEIEESRHRGQNLISHQDFIFKAWSLYKPRQGPPPLPFPLDDLLNLLETPLPENVQNYLQQGHWTSRYREPAQLKTELQQLLTAEGQLWPLLKRVQIRGPFEILKGGLQLVDLPGLNDPNPVREDITRAYLKQAEFIWLTFNLSRGLTRDVMDLLKDGGFLTQIILDGTLSALALVGTRADEFIPALERQQLGLPLEANLDAILEARRQQIQLRLREQLSELTLWFSHRYRLQAHSRDVLQLISQTLAQSPLFLVSALEYQRLNGWYPGEGLLTEIAQTGIPALKAWLAEVVSKHGLQARKKMIRSQCQQMNQEIKRLLQRLQGARSAQQLQAMTRQTLYQQFIQARQSLEQGLSHIHQALIQRQTTAQQALLENYKNYLNHSRDELPELLARWGAYPWQILQRAVRQQGRYTSPTSGTQLMLPEELADFLLGGIAPLWYDYFHHSLKQEPEQLLKEVLRILQDYAQTIQTLSQQVAGAEDLSQRLEAMNQSCVEILQEQALQTGLRLQEDLKTSRRQLGSLILKLAEEALHSACEQAAQYFGSGLKQQILETLKQGLTDYWPILAQHIQEQITSLLQTIQHHLVLYVEMMRSVLHEHTQLLAGLLTEQP